MISGRHSLSGRSKEPRNLDSEKSRQESCDQQVDKNQIDQAKKDRQCPLTEVISERLIPRQKKNLESLKV